jgi:hypothetical protein
VLVPLGRAGLLAVNGTVYRIYAVELPEADPARVAGYRLVKADGTVYDVDTSAGRPCCDCGDATFRRRTDGLCKHGKAILGLRNDGKLA